MKRQQKKKFNKIKLDSLFFDFNFSFPIRLKIAKLQKKKFPVPKTVTPRLMTTKSKGLHRKHSLIAEHYDGFVDKMLVRRKGVPDYYYQLNADQNEKNELIMQSMNTKINYLKNPRYKKDRAPIKYADAVVGTMRDPACPFRADPEVILFEDYSLNEIYSISMTLVNSDKVLRRVKFIPPSSGEFSIANVIYPTVETGLIAPGNHVVFEIFFKANSLADYDDELIIITEENNFRIP
jgi:hypothetical protein